MSERPPLKVFVTVDTEVWPLDDPWPRQPLPAGRPSIMREHDIYVQGSTARGEFGLPFILDTLRASNLRATFFVESLHALAVGDESLANSVKQLQGAGQDIQLHAHTEWLGDIRNDLLPRRFGPAIGRYTRAEQRAILGAAADALAAVSGTKPRAFRAGSYGADRETLNALGDLGIEFDTSHNSAFAAQYCRLAATNPLDQPAMMGSVREYPVSCFEDYPGHVRHAQICAISTAEMEWLLRQAWSSGREAVVIVLHSSEFIHKRQLSIAAHAATPNWRVIRRFRFLCEFLAANAGWLTPATFGAIVTDAHATPLEPAQPLRSGLWRTLGRTAAQAFNRIESRWE
jgi:peptidoglycan/xylan/chitin deacetylase (PgdA/CDA1 family)